MRVLIADDNITDLNGIRDFTPWDKLGCEVVATARNGAEGLEKALKTKPDLIVADISMPMMDGITMCRKIKEKLPNIHVIFLSCLEDFEYAKQAINIGRCDYITKPIDIDLVINSIMKMKNAHDNEIKKELTIFNLEKEITKNKPQLIKSFLRDMILGISTNKNFIHRRANEFNIDINSTYTEILFEMNDTSANSSVSSQLLSNLIQSLLLENFKGWLVDIKIGSSAAIITDNIDFNKLVDILGIIQHDFLEICDAELTICIGSSNIPFKHLHEEFERLAGTLNDNLFYTPNSIVFADEFHNKNTYSENNINVSELNKDISSALASDYEDAVVCLIDKYLPKENQLLAKAAGCYITVCLNMILYKMNITSDVFNIENAGEHIMNLKTYSQIRNYLKETLLKCRSALNSEPTTSANYIVDKIMNIIKTEYSSTQTVEDITDKLYLNPLYANRIFKQQTGKTIYEYLQDIRMEKAMELLKKSPKKAGEIGESVGFRTARYFSTVFKNYTGLTPIQYRQKHSAETSYAEEE